MVVKPKFIKFNKYRILLSTIKRYNPVMNMSINVRFSTINTEVFKFDTTDDRDAALALLDLTFNTVTID